MGLPNPNSASPSEPLDVVREGSDRVMFTLDSCAHHHHPRDLTVVLVFYTIKFARIPPAEGARPLFWNFSSLFVSHKSFLYISKGCSKFVPQ